MLDQLSLFAEGFLASPGASPDSNAEQTTTAISGRRCEGLLPLLGHAGSLARTLAALFRTRWVSTEFSLIWKLSATPAKRCVFRLVPSTRRTSATAFGSWPTPTVVDRIRNEETMAKCAEFRLRNAKQKTVPLYLGEVAQRAAAWPTPAARDHKSGLASAETMERNARPLSEVAAWSTPRASDGEKGGPNQSFGAGGRPLASMAAWATPTAGCDGGSRNLPGSKAHAGVSLGDIARGTGGKIARAGATPNGSGASSTSAGGALNPEFVCWLMGYPEGWLD